MKKKYSFDSPLVMEQVSAGTWRVHKSFGFFLEERPKELTEYVRVPEGFLTDFASVPWPASMLIPKSGLYNQAAVMHDYLYSLWPHFYNRAESDKLFLEGMKVLGVNPVKRWTMYQAVRRFGWACWSAKIKKRLKEEGK